MKEWLTQNVGEISTANKLQMIQILQTGKTSNDISQLIQCFNP